jgi:Holliday junction resolvase RusA-like endonuclease
MSNAKGSRVLPEGPEYGDFNPQPRGPELVHLELPQPPSANDYWRKFRNRIVESAAAKQYKEAIWMLCGRYRTIDNQPVYPLEDVVVTIRWWRRRGKNNQSQGDLQNYEKVLLDALQGTVYANDRQVAELHMYRMPDESDERFGRVVVNVSACG